MPEPIEIYLDQVMSRASLSPPDARRVRSELKEHLYELATALAIDPKDPKETLTMFANEFGDPCELGASISASKGRIRTYLKKKLRRLSIAAGILLVMGLGVRATIAEEFKVSGDGVSPILTKGSRCFVYKLSSSFAPDDVIVYKPAEHPEQRYLAVVKDIDPTTGNLHATRNNAGVLTIARSAVVGKVFLSTR
jgi:hypothetical protein